MAQMHPPSGPRDGTQSNAERHLYTVLRALPADWHVIHGVERFNKAGNGKPVEGEIDFLIIHPEFGILVLEVKGGRIAYDAATGRWTTTNKTNQVHALTPPPPTQIKDSVRLLKTFIKNTFATDGVYSLTPAIWFYDSEWIPQSLLAFPDELIMDSRNLADPQSAIERAFIYNKIARESGKLTPEAIEQFIMHLEPTFAPPTLSEGIRVDQRLLDLLTLEQSDRLTGLLQKQRQCAIPGEAGTGKTILAFETARLLARSHWRTLLVCVNAFQAHWLKEKQDAECDVTRDEHFDICDIADLCSQYVSRSHIRGTSITADQVVEASGQNTMAHLLQRSIEWLRRHPNEAGEWQYDAVLVDEGQDIEKPLLSAISHLLRDRRDGYFCVWYDPFQRLDFDTDWELPFTLHTTPPLTQNLRNSRAIWDAMAGIRPDLHLFDFTGPEGNPITYIAPPTPAPIPPQEGSDGVDDGTGDAVRAVLRDLINTQGITPGDILLITCRADRASQWRAWRTAWQDEISLRALTQLRQTKDEERPRFVKFSTIRASKGLESNIVILVELDGIAHPIGTKLPMLRRRDKLLYVAISRARHGLYVVGPPTALTPLTPPA